MNLLQEWFTLEKKMCVTEFHRIKKKNHTILVDTEKVQHPLMITFSDFV